MVKTNIKNILILSIIGVFVLTGIVLLVENLVTGEVISSVKANSVSALDSSLTVSCSATIGPLTCSGDKCKTYHNSGGNLAGVCCESPGSRGQLTKNTYCDGVGCYTENGECPNSLAS